MAGKGVGLAAEIDFVAWEETMEWAQAEAACSWVEEEAEPHTDLAHPEVRMELDYQIAVGMGMGLLVVADSDTAAGEVEACEWPLVGMHYLVPKHWERAWLEAFCGSPFAVC